MVFLTRRYRFSASHRLHNEALDAEENARLYGKCNNPFGHGHNYALEVTVGGPVELRTGMVMNLETLDQAVEEEVIAPFDHVNLNLDVACFHDVVPTTENLCLEIFRRLERKLGGGSASRAFLERVRLEETSSNFFEVVRDSESRPGAKGPEREPEWRIRH
jgi:6-pyruvoyltetrahydropterin/6-carboxytetrahydropterin synthase